MKKMLIEMEKYLLNKEAPLQIIKKKSNDIVKRYLINQENKEIIIKVEKLSANN